MTITRHSPVPMYSQVREQLLDQITSGRLRPGDKAPSERALSASLGISRMTARAAMKGLVDAGFFYTVPGKGTFVANPSMLQELNTLTSFSEDMRRRALSPGSELIEFALATEADPEICKHLQVPPGTELTRISRLRTADAEPMCIETAHIPKTVAPWLNREMLTSGHASLYELLETHGVRLKRAEQYLEATLVPDHLAERLTVPTGSPALLIRRVAIADHGTPVEYTRSLYRGDRYTFRTAMSL